MCESKMSSGFESKIFAIALKASESDQKLQSVAGGLARVVWFRVPGADLRVGTLDLLMSLSDDLSKMDTVAEGAVWKIYRQLLELQPGVPTIQGVDVATYAFKQFDWDEAKFQVKTPLRELCESIASRIGGLDEELKAKMSEYNAVKGALTASERKAQGNLMVRGLTDIVREEDLRGTDESDWMSTMLVVVPKNGLPHVPLGLRHGPGRDVERFPERVHLLLVRPEHVFDAGLGVDLPLEGGLQPLVLLLRLLHVLLLFQEQLLGRVVRLLDGPDDAVQQPHDAPHADRAKQANGWKWRHERGTSVARAWHESGDDGIDRNVWGGEGGESRAKKERV